MRKAKAYLIGSLTVAGVGVALRFAQTANSVYIAGKLGAEGIGFLTLVTSVYALAVTFACSGVGLTCTRLVAEALGRRDPREARKSLAGCVLYSLFFGVAAALLLYALSGVIGRRLLGGDRAVYCLRALCPALPAAALSSCFSGCFNAVRRAYKASIVSVIDQGARILLCAFFFSLFLSRGMGVEAVLYASCVSEILTFLLMLLLLLPERKSSLAGGGTVPRRLGARICGISLPIAVAAWVRAALVTGEHILIPRGLETFGDPSALATYGVMHGMALPVVFLPYAVLTPFTQLLIPEFSRFRAEKDARGVSFTASLTLRMTMLFAFGCSAFFAAFGETLGELLYKTEGVGRFVALFALLIPVMYLDTAVDAVLKGLGEQFYCMLVNIGDAGLSLLLVLLLVPRAGAVGYLWTVFICETFNTVFSFLRLRKKVALSFRPLRSLALPALCAFAASLAVKTALLRLPAFPGLRLTAAALSFLPLYGALLLFSGALTRADRRYFARLFQKERRPEAGRTE